MSTVSLLPPAVALGNFAASVATSFSDTPDITQISAPLSANDTAAGATVTPLDVMAVAGSALTKAEELQTLLAAEPRGDSNPNLNGIRLADCGNRWSVMDHNSAGLDPQRYQFVGLYRTGQYVMLDHQLDTGVRGVEVRTYCGEADSAAEDVVTLRKTARKTQDGEEVIGRRIEIEIGRERLIEMLTRIQTERPEIFGEEHSALNFSGMSIPELGLFFGALYAQNTVSRFEVDSTQKATDAVHQAPSELQRPAPAVFSFVYNELHTLTITQRTGADVAGEMMPIMRELAQRLRLSRLELQAIESRSVEVSAPSLGIPGKLDHQLHYVSATASEITDDDLTRSLSTIPDVDDATRLAWVRSIVDFFAPRFAGTIENDDQHRFSDASFDVLPTEKHIPIHHARILMMAAGLRQEQIERFIHDDFPRDVNLGEIVESLEDGLHEMRLDSDAYQSFELHPRTLQHLTTPILRGEFGVEGMRELERLVSKRVLSLADIAEEIADGLREGWIQDADLARAIPGTWLEPVFIAAFAVSLDGSEELVIADVWNDGQTRDLVLELTYRSLYLASLYERAERSYDAVQPGRVDSIDEHFGDGEGGQGSRDRDADSDDES